MIRTRIAPSPTGYPHIATIYQALFDYAFARKSNGKFLIRIEDTDRERFVADAEEKLYEAIDWFGLTEDESPRKKGEYGPYKQSECLILYKTYAEELLTKGYAYYCFCTRERLEEVRKQQQAEKKPMMYDKHCRNLSKDEVTAMLAEKKPHVIRLKVPENEQIIVKDEIRGEISFDANLVDDQVLLKSDGFPTYHLAVVVDDHLMKITHVVRGEEWLSSFPKHALLYRYFDWQMPLFYHTAVLRNPDHSKLSKRQRHTNVSWYQEEGYLPEAILNYIALLGWSHPEEKEIFSLQEFIALFDLKDIKALGPIFDIEKLKWMNGEYIRMMTDEGLENKLKEFYKNDKEVYEVLTNSMTRGLLIGLAKTRMKTLKEFKTLVIPAQVELNEHEKEVAQALRRKFEQSNEWNKETILASMKEVLKEYKIKGSILYKILTGYERGIPLPEALEILGKEETLKRISNI